MEKRYGRAQFLKDAISLGLPTYSAFSRTTLRRQRDRLILQHHPDRGGTEDRAQEINELYARMVRWLNSRSQPGSRRSEAPRGREPQDCPRPHHMVATAAFWAAGALITSRFLASRRRNGF
jgi:hypothetical protein